MMKIRVLKRSNFIFMINIFVLFCIEGCSRTVVENSGGNVEISSRINSIFEKTKKVCFGRVIMEIPYEAMVVYGPAEVDASIEFREGEANRLDQYSSARLREIETEREYLDDKDLARLPHFGRVIEGSRPGQKIIIGSKDQIGYAVMSLLPIEGDLIVQAVDGGLPGRNFIKRIDDVAKLLKPRRSDDIPVEPGFCIEGGLIAGEYEFERATIGVRFSEFPDVHFSVDAHKNLNTLNNEANPKTLHERARINADAAGLGAVFSLRKILREQIRHIGHWNGQEIALRTPAYKGTRSVHHFRFHSVGSVNDPHHPQLDVQLDSGVRDNAKGVLAPSITDDEALILWDTLIKSIRLREPGDATPVKVDKVPLATRVRTGEICPESGWWEVVDKRLTVHNPRQFLHAGDQVPCALTLRGVPLWERFFNSRELNIAMTWMLVAYKDTSPESAPKVSTDGFPEATDGYGDKHA
jgi:hypothetical protein